MFLLDVTVTVDVKYHRISGVFCFVLYFINPLWVNLGRLTGGWLQQPQEQRHQVLAVCQCSIFVYPNNCRPAVASVWDFLTCARTDVDACDCARKLCDRPERGCTDN